MCCHILTNSEEPTEVEFIMVKIHSAGLFLAGALALVGLTGCEKLEQAANDAVESAKQSAVQALDEARQAGSIEEAKQSADRLLLDAKQQAAGLLQQAGQYLAEETPTQDSVSGSKDDMVADPQPTNDL